MSLIVYAQQIAKPRGDGQRNGLQLRGIVRIGRGVGLDGFAEANRDFQTCVRCDALRRVRNEGDPVFVELKKKFDGVVYKRRVTTELSQVEPFLTGLLEKDAFGQIGREIDWFQRCNKTVPKVFIGYDRMAFAGIDDAQLRVTFDAKLRWRTSKLDLAYGDYGQLLLPQDAVLMEIKLPGVCPLWLGRALSELSIYPTSFSKYGACYQRQLLPRMQKTRWEDMFCA